jgi:hypothetical protein
MTRSHCNVGGIQERFIFNQPLKCDTTIHYITEFMMIINVFCERNSMIIVKQTEIFLHKTKKE